MTKKKLPKLKPKITLIADFIKISYAFGADSLITVDKEEGMVTISDSNGLDCDMIPEDFIEFTKLCMAICIEQGWAEL